MEQAQSNENLILFTITPVQKFITTARKTEDLWLGSYILSYLNATAIDQIYDKPGIEIIYPFLDGKPFDSWQREDITLPSFPNLFLALSQRRSLDELEAIMQRTEETVQSEFQKMAEFALGEAFRGREWRGTYAEKLFNKQVKHFFELYWVVSPKCGQNYAEWYQQTGARLAAVKNCRAFVCVEEHGRKCSLDGEREIVHPGKGDLMAWWKAFAQRSPRFCRQGEALSTVSLTKRMAKAYFESRFGNVFRDVDFPSTSEVSTAAFKSKLAGNQEAMEIYSEFVGAVKNLSGGDPVKPLPKISRTNSLSNNIDGQWLFDESLSEHYHDREYGITVPNQDPRIKACKKKLKALIEKVGFEPCCYYAIIVLDGDNMGKTIAQAQGAETHTEISKRLNEYTKCVRQVVEENHLGKLVYAGGDDVLALANLTDLLDILHGLRWKFPDLIEGQKSTASAGVCIAHCKTPLGDVLDHAREMEKAAKKVDCKNAIGIALMKHSGNISQTVVK